MFERPPNPESKLPVTLITGFLGSGKTTFINQLLENVLDLRIAVLVNELGQIDIDGQLIKSQDKNKVELTNGCICCSINDSLMQSVIDILARRDTVDYLVVETTGVADPLPIMQTFLATELWSFTRLDAVVTLVDAESFDLKTVYNSKAAGNQILYGDILVLNKVDLVTGDRVEGLRAELTEFRPKIRVLTSSYGQVPWELLLDVNLTKRETLIQDQLLGSVLPKTSSHLQDDGFISIDFKSHQPFNLRSFQRFLESQLSLDVIRGKGVLWFEESEERHVFQLCGQRITLENTPWQDQPKTELVLIGRNLDSSTLQQQLQECVVKGN